MNEARDRLVVGTRGSALALAQAAMTESALREAHPALAIERRIIKTTGDRRTDVPLSEVAAAEGHLDKGVFIKELEVALENGEIDVAVHSMKDMPSALEDNFEVAAVLPRAPSGDVLVSKSEGGLDELPEGAIVATSSVRRQRMLLDVRPDLLLADIRGNVPTRLRKLGEEKHLDGLVLAEAGLLRLGFLQEGFVRNADVDLPAVVLDAGRVLPAAGQGAVALEIVAEKGDLRELLAPLNHEETFDAVAAERRFLELLGAGCDTPVGVLSRIDRDHLFLRAMVFEDGEEQPLIGEMAGLREDAAGVAQRLLRCLKRRES